MKKLLEWLYWLIIDIWNPLPPDDEQLTEDAPEWIFGSNQYGDDPCHSIENRRNRP